MTAETPPVLVLEGVEHTFLSLRVLKGIQLAIHPGEVVGFVGSNGAGKTTTLRIAATLLRPTRGRVTVAGRDALADPVGARSILGFMPEQFGVYDDMRVREYLEFFADAHEVAPAAAATRIERWIEDAALDPGRNVGQLSRGSKQRLFFARTFIHDPALLLLDEPFSGMDPMAAGWTIDIIRREAGSGRAFVISSHDLAELERVATRIVALRDGRIAPPTVGPGAVYIVRTEGGEEEAAGALRSALPDGEVRPASTGQGWEVALPVAPESDSELLRRLVAAGVRVCAFERQTIGIRDVYARPSA